ncbi:MAG: C1 family peptidase [Salinivirgaceae bacterium]|nr:C1 family peptidase [Salinivirgaceae bacterium]
MARILIGLLLVIVTFSNTYSQKGSIDPAQVQKMREAFNDDPSNTMRMNALSNNDAKDISLNRENVGTVDHHFKYRVDVTGITDQHSSGRCWLYTSLNVLRPAVIDNYSLKSFEFSQNHLFFWDQFEKANLFLENILAYANEPVDNRYNQWLLKSPIGDGGVWNSFTNLVSKYGLVPQSVMPDTYNAENTSRMRKLLSRKLREFALELRSMTANDDSGQKINDRKLEMMGVVYKMLALNLGQPPVEFQYRFVDSEENVGEMKTFTPLTFAQTVLTNVDYSEFVMLMNDPTREYYKLYEIENDRNVMEGINWRYINLPNEDIKQYALNSIKANDAMYGSCDVGKQINATEGLLDVDNYDFESLYGIDFSMDKKSRIISRESGSSHGMAIVAVDVDDDEKPVKWQFENSWGSKSGQNGYLTFTDEWFDEYMFRVVILKKHLPEKVLKILEQEPTMLPPWDPMFCADF